MGLGFAASYLVMAVYSGKDNATTEASANAIEKVIGIHHRQGTKYIAGLQTGSLVERIDRNPRPRCKPVYRLLMPAKPELIWLPNRFVVDGPQMTPLKRLWRMQDAKALRCCADLYFWNYLPTDGGICRDVLRLPFERHEVACSGERVIWGFRQEEQRALGDAAATELFDMFSDWELLGQAPHLFMSDEPDAPIIHPYGMEGAPSSIEHMIGMAAHEAGLALVSEEQRRWAKAERLWLAPVPRDIPRVAMIGIARLRHQPETQTTADWRRELVENAPRIIADYQRLASSVREALAHVV
jgi:hypothetical protein